MDAIEYKPKFPVTGLVHWEDFKRSPFPAMPTVDPRKPGAWAQAVEICLSLQRQWIRNESWYWEANEHAVMVDGAVHFFQPDYPVWDPKPGYELHQPLGDSGMMRTAEIE